MSLQTVPSKDFINEHKEPRFKELLKNVGQLTPVVADTLSSCQLSMSDPFICFCQTLDGHLFSPKIKSDLSE